jgi:hypothetical protein
MQVLRFICVLLLLKDLSSVKASPVRKVICSDRIFQTNVTLQENLKAFQRTSGHERFAKAKKIKQRGMGGVSPNVIHTDLLEIVSYCQYIFIPVESNYASFLYCVGCKRGPPIAA